MQLGDPVRVRLLSMVATGENREACICELTEPIGLSQPTVSHHMKLLTQAGITVREQRGKWAYYRVATGVLEALAGSLAAGERVTP